MTTIIEMGIIPKEQSHRVRCPICKTVYEFTRSEATPKHSHRFFDFLHSINPEKHKLVQHLVVECPCCKEDNYWKYEKVDGVYYLF